MGEKCPYTIRLTPHESCDMVNPWKMLGNTAKSSTRISTKEVEIMLTYLETMLYIDSQGAVPACFCQDCGGERYAPGLLCLRCERRSL